MKAYALRFGDACVIVFASSATAAHQQWRVFPDALWCEVTVDRAPEFDRADPRVPVRFVCARAA